MNLHVLDGELAYVTDITVRVLECLPLLLDIGQSCSDTHDPLSGTTVGL